jgi:pimeloyl-ACP methyl ester carboxylesterase
LHGYLSNSNSFYNQIKFFEREYQIFCPDFKGFGNNAGMEYPYSLDDYKKDLIEYMDKNNVNKPHVVAHSFGGRVALKLSSQNAQAFDKMVLTGCAGLKPKNTLNKTTKKVLFNFLKKFVKKERLKRFYSSDYLSLDPIMQQSFIKIVSEHLDDCLINIENPTLLLFGQNDKQTPLYMAKRLKAGIKNSKLIIFENSGHFCFLDKPIKFNTEVKEFLLS